MLYGEVNEITTEQGTLKGIKVNIQHPKKSAILRMPTAKELRSLSTKYEDRKRQKNPSTDSRPHMELFRDIRVDQGEQFDQYEAEYAINQLCAFTCSAEMVEGNFIVTIKTKFCDVTLTLRLPSLKELHEASTAPNIKKYLALFDALLSHTDGYAEGYEVPDAHKTEAILRVLDHINTFDPVEVDPN